MSSGVPEILAAVRSAADHGERLTKKAEDCAVEVIAGDMSVQCDGAQTKAAGEFKDNDSGARGVSGTGG